MADHPAPMRTATPGREIVNITSAGRMAKAFLALWWTLGVLLVVHSVQTGWQALGAGRNGVDVHVAMLASAEAIAGLLFLHPRTMRAGGGCLLAVFAIAFVLHGARGEFPSQLLLYAVAVSFVMVHGPVAFRRSTSNAHTNLSG
jgi:hypothetical protein